jgi:hypothetical protein
VKHNISRVRAFAIKLKGSEVVRTSKALVGYLPYRMAVSSGNGVVYDINDRMGMGAILATAVRIHAWSEDTGIPASIISTSPLYAAGPSFLENYFDRPPLLTSAASMGRVAQDWICRKAMPQHISLVRASQIFSKYFKPKSVLTSVVDEMIASKAFDLSIHFRGTDKVLESGKVEYESILRKAQPYLETGKKVFLATDDAEFSRIIRHEYPNIEFVSYDLGETQKNVPRHFSNLAESDKAMEALVNMFAIAKSPLCVRTSSYMSSFSKIINPSLQTITINKTESSVPRFPEYEIIQAEL